MKKLNKNRIGRKVVLLLFVSLFSTSIALGQTEVFKNVVNNLAFYKQKKEIKFLGFAKKSIDSLIRTRADSADLKKSVYKAIVYSSIASLDSLNKLNQPVDFFEKTRQFIDKIASDRKSYKYQTDIDYAKHCIANVFLRKGFAYTRISDYNNAMQAFLSAKKYAPDFKNLNAYIAYTNNRLGNLLIAAKYYNDLLKTDSTKAEYIEAAANTFKAIGDTSRALKILQNGRKYFPDDKVLLLDEANIYNNRLDYQSLELLLPKLLEQNSENEEVALVGAKCYEYLHKFDKAEALYLHSIELNNTIVDPIYSIGLLYLKRSLLSTGEQSMQYIVTAGQWLEKANDIAPNDAKCLQLLKLIYTKTGERDKLDQINNKLKLLTNQ